MIKVVDFMDCYIEKQAAIKDFGEAIAKHQSNVDSIEYQLWAKQFETGIGKEEFIIINYRGGARSVLNTSGNSFSANCRAICEYLDHGYYNTSRYDQVSKEFERVI